MELNRPKGKTAWNSLAPEFQELMRHPLRRRLLRALHTQRLPSTVRELMSREGLTKEASARLNYHARLLARAGLLTVVEELPVYRSQLAKDADALAYLEATREADERATRDG